MAPFTHRHCPCCSATTTQHFLLLDRESQDAGDKLQTICESCQTVLIYRADGSVGQRVATPEEREYVPPKPDLSKEPWPTMREELRRGRAELEAWIQAGCPSLTREMLSRFSPSAVAALARYGIRVTGDAQHAQQRHAEPPAAPDRPRD
jgi:hypothetical protein